MSKTRMTLYQMKFKNGTVIHSRSGGGLLDEVNRVLMDEYNCIEKLKKSSINSFVFKNSKVKNPRLSGVFIDEFKRIPLTQYYEDQIKHKLLTRKRHSRPISKDGNDIVNEKYQNTVVNGIVATLYKEDFKNRSFKQF